jgi:hypothetical protein
MNIYQKVKKLNLPKGKYAVGSGSALEGYGIRKCNDIDILVTKDIYLNLKKKGWKETTLPNGLTSLIKEPYEIAANINYNEYQTPTWHLIKTANIIKGIPFINLREIIKFKKEMNRDKDKEDIKLIKNYFRSQT